MILRSKVRVFLDLYNTRRNLTDGWLRTARRWSSSRRRATSWGSGPRALEQAQRDHRELTEFIVHDLKNPLSIAYPGLDWVSEQIPPPQGDVGQALADSREATMRLRSMIEDLLTISRMEQADFPLQRELLSRRRAFYARWCRGSRRTHSSSDIVLVPPPD